ncbi:hypothetical protein [Mycolicibacterium sp. J2]|jgi:hypothetical protein|uniref:hypothetical protein n=1 Tax=Mycolicibacterium sp. J2 TaxID=2993511 RepID=UPI00224A7A0B|nr:hypothetical protein [Mycolicibacterium sp. J2]MCX2713195.1 hypothetical protein [Mycolicibacterium sp. J2]
MMRKTASTTLLLAACAAGAGIALAPVASADPNPCQNAGTATVCQAPGSASESATPPVPGNGAQNGPYGPNGGTPPVGGNS